MTIKDRALASYEYNWYNKTGAIACGAIRWKELYLKIRPKDPDITCYVAAVIGAGAFDSPIVKVTDLPEKSKKFYRRGVEDSPHTLKYRLL